MKYFELRFIFLLILLAFLMACGQTQPISNKGKNPQVSSDKRVEKLKSQANEFLQSAFDENMENLSKFIYYPKIIIETPEKIKEYKEKNANKLIQELKGIKSEGLDFKFEWTIEEPQEMISADNQIFSIVPFLTITKASGLRCDGKDFLLGITQDNGENWEFFKGNSSGEAALNAFPEASKKIKLPEKPKPNCYQE